MKVINEGLIPKDDPIWRSGPVVGGKRIGRKKPVFAKITPDMDRDRVLWNLCDVLLKSGFNLEDKLKERFEAIGERLGLPKVEGPPDD